MPAAVFAQTTAPTAYSGPRYPGGPDSLRALVARSTRAATPAPAGRMLVQFELKPDGKAYHYTLVRPPEPLNKPLVNATAAALDYLEAHMLAWQPAPPDPDFPNKSAKITLPIDFTAPPAAQPYYYADQNPVFDAIPALLRARRQPYLDAILADPAKLAAYKSSPQGMSTVVQMQVLYPPEALRFGQQGIVYAYFEVAENGAIEQSAILGTAGRALDAEVLRVLKKFPAATSPAQFQGRPVRVSYVLPVTFKIQ
ncbi:hypothetical protein GCM10027345_41800 [Hymenobacter daeguensis]